jgi:glycosyltransferase involved in cell wall biosynthesis
MDSTALISVVICTHNPVEQYLNRVLAALRAQDFDYAQWELIVVDNASSATVADRFDVSWHPAGRHVREDQLGLTHARVRGIEESRGRVVVFVDDDNVLSSTYLREAAAIAVDFPFIGVWGGQVKPEFEVKPQRWTEEFWPLLALRETDRVHFG